MRWLLLAASLVTLYLLLSLVQLSRNYFRARLTGFPMYICLVNPNNPIWMTLSVPLEPTLRRYLPSFAYQRVRRCIYGWEFRETTAELDIRPGPAFVLVTPGKNELWVEEPELGNQIVTRRKDFVLFDIASLIMGIFGPNLLTSEGDDWQRQRRLVAPLLNERISNLVWSESLDQAKDMVSHFMSVNNGRTADTIEGLRAIAIHVLGAVGYGMPQPWKEEKKQEVPPGHKLTYIDALHAVVNDFIFAALLPARVLTLWIMPQFLRKLGLSVQEFPLYTREMLQKERQLAAASSQSRNNLMSTLVKASDREKTLVSKGSLLESEITGNLFQFTIAGFDTTANTLAYAVTSLAASPEWQDWIIEEIDHVLKQSKGRDYEETFPKLGRCLALLHETLRFYTPVPHISRSTAKNSPQQLTTSTKTHHVPGNTTVYVNVQGMHRDEKIWGPDARTFRPTRWLGKGSTLDKPLHITPPRGTFLPWSAGPRACPGMKMAQVEFVAVMFAVFRRARASPVVRGSETKKMAAERLKTLMQDSQPRITLQMNKPKEVVLRWEMR